jgi:hypothetical protein
MDGARANIAALHSRRFNSAQENYNTTNTELLAIVDALQAFETKLLGIKFTVVTDLKALVYLMTKPMATGRLARWLEHMQMFEFAILHTPGETNQLLRGQYDAAMSLIVSVGTTVIIEVREDILMRIFARILL